MLTEVDTFYGDNLQAVNRTVIDGTSFSGSAYSQALKTVLEIDIASFVIGNSNTSWAIMIAASEDHILTEVRTITRFTVILAVIAILLTAVIIYFTLNNVTKPIVKVADTLRDISEGEGDLTRTILIHSKDEVGDLAKYFNNTLEKIKNLIIAIK